MVTVAVRRVNLDRTKESLLDFIDREKFFLLPNTAGCYTADEAIRAARLGREVGLSDWVKIEVIGDERTLYPDVQGTLEATRILLLDSGGLRVTSRVNFSQSPRSPSRKRASRSAVQAVRSSRASSIDSSTERTAWPTSMPPGRSVVSKRLDASR